MLTYVAQIVMREREREREKERVLIQQLKSVSSDNARCIANIQGIFSYFSHLLLPFLVCLHDLFLSVPAPEILLYPSAPLPRPHTTTTAAAATTTTTTTTTTTAAAAAAASVAVVIRCRCCYCMCTSFFLIPKEQQQQRLLQHSPSRQFILLITCHQNDIFFCR